MKKLFLLLAFAATAIACQVIPEDAQLIEPEVAGRYTNRNVVLVEFTGWKCPNCPTAAEIAHKLLHVFKEQLIVVEMHPASNGLTKPKKDGSQDYTCEEADTYYAFLGGTNVTSFPTGVLNMSKQQGSSFTEKETWATQVYAQVQTVGTADIEQLTASYDADTREIQVSADIVNATDEEQLLNVVFWLTEDSIVGQQSMPDGSVNKEYLHQHVLRQAIGDVWGQECPLDAKGMQHAEATALLREDVVPVNCHVVAVVLNPEREILNALQVALMNK